MVFTPGSGGPTTGPQEPKASIQLKNKKMAVTAELLSDEEKESVWEQLVSNIPNYSAYKERTDRNIKVYRLVPC
jgi:hypothetical protein